jgi:hypothetical protein
MDTDDIIRSWADMMFENLYAECRESGADGLVEQVAYEYPDMLKSEFNVDTSLVA